MNSSYEHLVQVGAIALLKEQVLLEVVRDLDYVGSVHEQIQEHLEADDLPASYTVRFIEELIAKGFVKLATWAEGYGSKPRFLDTTKDTVPSIVDRTLRKEVEPFEYFLWSTELGNDWVARHEKLSSEF